MKGDSNDPNSGHQIKEFNAKRSVEELNKMICCDLCESFFSDTDVTDL